MRIIIENSMIGLTVKELIALHIPGLSRRMLSAMKNRPDGILLNGLHVTVRARLKEGDVLELNYDDREGTAIPPGGLLPPILYEDDAILVLNKPAPMPTHPSMEHYTDTLANAVVAYLSTAEKPFVFRVLNRLDSVTSGVVIVAKDHLASCRLARSLEEGRVSKNYLALCEGELTEESGSIAFSIKRDPDSIIKRMICEADEGEHALTRYRVLWRANGRSLLACTPITGRTHQIRLHLSSIGHPVLGDFLYGESHDRLDGRVALHCYAMTFPHPTTGQSMTITAPMPEVYTDLMACDPSSLPSNLMYFDRK